MAENVAIIIPTYNRKDVTIKCINTILEGTYTDVSIIVCDSDSSDGTREEAARIKKVVVLDAGADAWWSAAVNHGINWALAHNYRRIVVMNDDIDIPRNLIHGMLEASRNSPTKIISPGQKKDQTYFFGTRYSKHLKTPQFVLKVAGNEPIIADSTNGCCLLIPSGVFEAIGLFDEKNCPHLAGDVEFQLRAKRNGFLTEVQPSLIIVQQIGTDYYRRLNIKTILTHKGSPVNYRAYTKLGATLFGNKWSFLFFGVLYHYKYFRGLAKAVIFSIKKSQKNDQKKNS